MYYATPTFTNSSVTTSISFLHRSENYGKIVEKAGDFKRNRESWRNFVKAGDLELVQL